MSKKTLLKGIIAVSAATTMLFSTAFAAKISSTRTLYVKGSTNTVEVATTVTGLTVGDEVTYLAGDAANPVYINQYTAGDTTETFTYKTTRISDLATTTVKMAKADSSFANGESIAAAATIANPEMYAFNVTIDGVPQNAIEVVPTNVAETISVPFTLESGKEIDTVEVNDVAATHYVVGESTITITHGVTVTVADDNTFADAAGNTSANIVITTKEEELPYTPETPAYLSGFKAASYTYTPESGDPISGPMYAVYAKSDKLPKNCEEFGIAIFNGLTNQYDYYKSTATKGEDFGIAIIEADVNIDEVVYVQTYYKEADADYVRSEDIITINLK